MGPGPIISWCSAMGELPRMNEAQSRRVKKLIRRLCANNEGGFCLLLDDGYDPCICPQLISNTLLCRYFRSAVLPADQEMCAEITGNSMYRKRCARCGTSFVPRSNRALYCDRCGALEKRRRICERVRRHRAER